MTLMTSRDIAVQREANTWLTNFTHTQRAWDVTLQLLAAPQNEASSKFCGRCCAGFRPHLVHLAARAVSPAHFPLFFVLAQVSFFAANMLLTKVRASWTSLQPDAKAQLSAAFR